MKANIYIGITNVHKRQLFALDALSIAMRTPCPPAK
jgi:hypothetical protein